MSQRNIFEHVFIYSTEPENQTFNKTILELVEKRKNEQQRAEDERNDTS